MAGRLFLELTSDEVSIMAFHIRKKRTGNKKIKPGKRARPSNQSNEQAKRQEIAEWDAIAESTKDLSRESDLELADDDG